ncbi:hypothetical protein MRX96_054522 [Rhipicephalus microplus]
MSAIALRKVREAKRASPLPNQHATITHAHGGAMSADHFEKIEKSAGKKRRAFRDPCFFCRPVCNVAAMRSRSRHQAAQAAAALEQTCGGSSGRTVGAQGIPSIRLGRDRLPFRARWACFEFVHQPPALACAAAASA